MYRFELQHILTVWFGVPSIEPGKEPRHRQTANMTFKEPVFLHGELFKSHFLTFLCLYSQSNSREVTGNVNNGNEGREYTFSLHFHFLSEFLHLWMFYSVSSVSENTHNNTDKLKDRRKGSSASPIFCKVK